MPIELLAGNLNAASDTSKILFGENGGKIITIGILISVYGTINGYTMTGMRVPYAMAERKLLPFSHLFAKFNKIWCTMVWRNYTTYNRYHHDVNGSI
ncbi:amino acid permease [Staphylococcus aureus]|nr:amino acid permease [Staphylococcus aureus]